MNSNFKMQVLACAAPEDAKGAPSSVDEVLLQDILGLAERKVLYEISNAVIQGNAKRCIELVAEVVMQGCDVCRLSRDLVEHFRNLIVTNLAAGKTDQSGRQLLDIPDQEIADLSSQVEGLSVEILLDYFDFMAAGDEEIARSANPRFALEAVLVRLSTLPQTLPAGLLVERLEELEQKLRGETKPHVSPPKEVSAPVRVPPSVMRPVAPASPVQTDSLKAETVKIEAGVSGDKDTVWQEFIAFIGKEKKFLASHLESCIPLELPPGQLKIGVADRHHLNYLQDAENLAALGSLAKRFFSADVALSVMTVSDGAAKIARREEIETSMPVAEKSETVKEALRIFGGSIRSVRREDR